MFRFQIQSGRKKDPGRYSERRTDSMEENYMTQGNQEELSLPKVVKEGPGIGAQIARLRRERGMTQEQLAGRLGVTFQAVSKWENAAACPDIALLPELADLFGITLDELFGRKASVTCGEEEGKEEKEEYKEGESKEREKSIPWEDDEKFRIVIFRGHTLLKTEDMPDHIKDLTITIQGTPADIISYLSVQCGAVRGNVTAGTCAKCGTVGGSVTAGMDVNCETVGGFVNAGGSVECTEVEGSVTAGGNVKCGNVEGNVNAGCDVRCGEVEGDLQAGGNAACSDVGGDVRAEGTVSCGDIEGDVNAGGDVKCGDIEGDVNTGGNVECGDVEGDINAGGNVIRK